ncbi:hypothetical protein QFX18_04445 [Saccharophagus degradans]|uniref:hypothetical protein n=1 Tax=Saccharophagus degradans TaxID=86304 RepID=UPI002477EEBD|nr:hypothetical protein [Saccharophagus degradans]WGO99308.1 hypothetical protein QFX18_04445 [Saccharophagus degradans]
MIDIKSIAKSAALLATGAIIAIYFNTNNAEKEKTTKDSFQANSIEATEETTGKHKLSNPTRNADIQNPENSNLLKEKDALIESLTLKVQHLEAQLQQPAKQKADTTEASEWFSDTNINKEKKIQSIEQQYNSTPYDHEKSKDIEEQLTLDIQNNENLSSFALGESECKKTTCRIQIATSDNYQLGGVINSFNNEFNSDPAFSGKAYLIVPDPSTGLASIYIADSEAELYSTH